MSVFTFSDLAFMGAAAGGLDPDAAAYIARVEGASGDNQALEDGVKTAINDFVIGCKADGIWNAIKASCIMAGARTLNGALVPLVGTAPTNFNFVAGDYNRKTGLVGDGSTKYLNSNRLINSDPQNNCHLSTWISQADTISAANIFPAPIGSQRNSSPFDGNAIFYFSSGRTLLAKTRTDVNTEVFPSRSTTGFAGVSRASSTQEGFRGNGTSIARNTTSSASQNNNVLVFNYAFGPAPSPVNYTNARLAFYSIGEALDLALLDARVTALINAFAAAIP